MSDSANFSQSPLWCLSSYFGISFTAQAPEGLTVAGPVQSGPCGGGSWFTQAWLDRSPIPFTGPEPWPNGLHIHVPSAQLKQHAVIQRQTDATLCAATATPVHNPTRTWSHTDTCTRNHSKQKCIHKSPFLKVPAVRQPLKYQLWTFSCKSLFAFYKLSERILFYLHSFQPKCSKRSHSLFIILIHVTYKVYVDLGISRHMCQINCLYKYGQRFQV